MNQTEQQQSYWINERSTGIGTAGEIKEFQSKHRIGLLTLLFTGTVLIQALHKTAYNWRRRATAIDSASRSRMAMAQPADELHAALCGPPRP